MRPAELACGQTWKYQQLLPSMDAIDLPGLYVPRVEATEREARAHAVAGWRLPGLFQADCDVPQVQPHAPAAPRAIISNASVARTTSASDRNGPKLSRVVPPRSYVPTVW